MKNYIQPGKTITLVAPYAVTSGQGARVGQLFGVANGTYASGADGEFDTEGVHELAKETGTAWTQGQKLYWDDTAKLITHTATSNLFVGHATVAAASGDAVGLVRLTGCPTITTF
jgi:predicted RecA/RadA family phage recombinase